MIIRLPSRRTIMEQSLNLFLAGLVLLPIYIVLMANLSAVLGFNTKITTYFYYGLLWCFLILSIPKITRTITRKVLTGIAVVAVLAVSQYILFPNNRRFLMGTKIGELVTFSPWTLLAVVPYVLLGAAVTDFDALRKKIHGASRIGVALGFLSYIIEVTKGMNIRYDDMNNAYAICTVVCFLLLNWQKGDGLFLLIGCFSLLLAGTRGPMLCVLVAVILKTVFLEKVFERKVLKLLACLIMAVLLLVGFLEIAVDLVAKFFALFGVTDLRIVDYIRKGMMLDSSGRDTISSLVVQGILKHPIVGVGVGGDRIVTQLNKYAHNIILEMWVSYGIFLGTAFLCWMAYWLAKGIQNRNSAVQMITAAFFSSVVVKLFLSSSYLYSKELFILLGLCMAGRRMQQNGHKTAKGAKI